MFLIKEIIVLASCLIIAAISFSGVSNSYKNYSPSSQQEDLNITNPSKEFFYYLDIIQNKSIDKEKVQMELNSLSSDFEREFLSALLKKRSGDFEGSFNQLFTLLKYFPSHLNYYEELSAFAKVTGRLDELSKWLNSNEKKSTDPFYRYLDALVEMNEGNSSVAIEKIKSLVGTGFASKEIYYQLAYLHRVIGDYDASLRNVMEAEKLCKDSDVFLSKIINLKGTIFYLSGEYEQAKKKYQSALEASIKSGNKSEEIKSFANLAIIKDVYGEIFEARDDFQVAIKMAEEIENMELLAFLYSELGVSFSYTASLIDSRKNYEKSFSLYEKLKNNERLSYLSSNIGSLYLQIANYKSALDYYSRGLNFAGENKLGQVLNLTGLGDVYSNQSNYSKALQYYSRAKGIADSVKDVTSALKIDQGIGALYYNINRPFNALEIFKKADSEISSNESPFEIVKLYSKIGTVLTSIDSVSQAETYFQKGLNLANNVGDIYSSIVLKTELAYNYFKQQNYDDAIKLLSEAQSSSREYELTQLLGLQELYLGKIYEAKNKIELSVEKYLAAFQISGSVHDYNNQIEAAYLLGQNYEKENSTNEAEKRYLAAIEIIEKISSPLSPNQEIQIAHFSGVNSVFNSLAELYLKQGRGEEAFVIIDKSRSRNTKTNLERLKLLSHFKDKTDYNLLIDLEWMISSGLYDEAVTDSLKEVVTKIKTEIVAVNKLLDRTLLEKKSKTIKDMQEKLGEDDHIVTIYIGEKFLTLFDLNSQGLSLKSINIGRDSLLSILKSVSPIYRYDMADEEIYVNEDLFSFNALAAYRLFKAVFNDFLSRIPTNSNLIVSFPPELVKLPIEMLVTEWKDGESPYYYSDKKFLLDEYQISYTPSATIYFIQMDKSVNINNQNLLIGNPFIMNTEYSLSVRSGLIDVNPSSSRNILLFPLEYSQDEIESIDKTITNNLIFTSNQATESNFKRNAPKSDIVHLSTHSFLLKDQPLIFFSSQGDKKEDGFLELGEIVQLNLQSELVVLSSCRSGLGKVDVAEGIVGMQKAFFEAGSKSVIVSLWDVNDKYTSYFMRDFYKHLAEGKSKSDALRQAKLEFIKNYSANPYYWSAFVLSGNPSSLKLQQASSIGVTHILLILLLIGALYFMISRIRLRNKNS
ncbi:MAG: CHAT domain-containing protein [Ignavibacteriaceae bacterium]|nr:CHAT domain-containing protein [Ignavibacteriaceae bacterium]